MDGATDQTAGSQSRDRRYWPFLVAILLLPVVVLWYQDNPLFSAPNRFDTWVYLGFFRNLGNFKRDLFPHTYYGSRLSWILPGYLANLIFSPLLAAIVLRLAVFWTAGLSLFRTLDLCVGRRQAFLTTIVFAANPQLWYEVGSDYVFGAGIAFCLLTVALFTHAAARQRNHASLLFAGVAIGSAIYSNYFWLATAPLLCLYYMALTAHLRPTSAGRLLIDLGKSAIGFLLVSLFLGGVNYLLSGSFWFYAPSVQAASTVVTNNPWYRSPWSSHGLAPWLWFTAVASVAAMFRILGALHQRHRISALPALLFSGLLIAALAILMYMQYGRHVALLGTPYYASTLLPFTFLVLGSSFWRAADRLTPRQYILVCCVAILALGAVWYDYRGEWTPVWPSLVLPVALASSLTLVVSQVFAQRAIGVLLAILGFTVFTSEVRFVSKTQVPAEEPEAIDRPVGPHTYRADMERIIRARARIEAVRRNLPIRFWYDDREPASPDYTALNATYLYLFTKLEKPFPEFSCLPQPVSDTVIVVFSNQEQAPETAGKALAACMSQASLQASLVANFSTQSPYGAYTTAIFELRRDPVRWHGIEISQSPAGNLTTHLVPYSPSRTGLPPQHWAPLYPELGSRVLRVPEGVNIETSTKLRTDAARYGPMAIPASGRYGFILRFTSKSGRFIFGVVSEKGEKWLAAGVSEHAGPDGKLECWLDLQQGQEIALHISNSVDANVSLVVHQLSAVEIDPAAPKGQQR